jgi:hypothetical protein
VEVVQHADQAKARKVGHKRDVGSLSRSPQRPCGGSWPNQQRAAARRRGRVNPLGRPPGRCRSAADRRRPPPAPARSQAGQAGPPAPRSSCHSRPGGDQCQRMAGGHLRQPSQQRRPRHLVAGRDRPVELGGQQRESGWVRRHGGIIPARWTARQQRGCQKL